MSMEMEDIHIVYIIIILMLHLCVIVNCMCLCFPSSFFLIEFFYAVFSLGKVGLRPQNIYIFCFSAPVFVFLFEYVVCLSIMTFAACTHRAEKLCSQQCKLLGTLKST